MEITLSSTEELQKLAGKLAKSAFAGDVYALYGELGAGKTTFTRFFVEALGFDVRVQSPTFVVVRCYEKDFGGTAGDEKFLEIKKIYHVDLYRLTSKEEVDDIGLKGMFTEEGAITVIEWPDIYESELPKDSIKIRFEYFYESKNENERKVFVENV